MDFSNASTAGSAAITNNGGDARLTFSGTSTASNATITNNGGFLYFFATSTAGNAAITNAAGGTVDFSRSVGPAGDGKLSAGSIAGAGNFYLGARELTVGGNNLSQEVSGVISDCGASGSACSTGGALVKIGTGALTLSGVNTYTGATTVNGGILSVGGSIASSLLTSVNSGGLLMGTGTVGNTTVNSGGALLGGNGTAGPSLAVSGNLAFQSGAFYFVQFSPATASFVSVGGTATLGGATVSAVFAPGSYITRQYTILTAKGGVSGTFGAVAETNLPSNLRTTLSYDATHAYLNLVLSFVPPPGSGLGGNQQGVGAAITNYFNSNGGIPIIYSALTALGLAQASGETATASQQATFDAMGQFMGLLTDPFIARNGGDGTASGAPGFAGSAYAAPMRDDAFAMLTKAPPSALQRWSVWGAGFGGAQSTAGNTVAGTNGSTSRIYGTAVGADYLLGPNTLIGFALAGGGTSFAVNGFGSGRSDLFQAGGYVRHSDGPFYLSSALAYGWQDISTDRTVTIAGVDRLRAAFNANAWSGRLEGGYRFLAPWTGGIGITPYAAGQATIFALPAYAEQAMPGTPAFALAYAAKSVTDSRSELGFRTDKSLAVSSGVLTLRGRFAWAHDFNPDRAIAATFQALPGASFVVNGARLASDSALTTASAEMKWMNGWSAVATFDGEFSNVTRSYAGRGMVRYAW
ncbi:autotransporter domain-containing protein [Bradyrhizobium sp. 2TAF24]|uniref:autotransporter family protein n=1 Tax=Bradyrhizobium sp. 2TAF24 TaxID=3233011 RepID=UPI003F8DA964